MKQQNIDIIIKLPPYIVLCDFELIPTQTLEEAINLADTHFQVIEIYKRAGTTGRNYTYLCNVSKINSNERKTYD